MAEDENDQMSLIKDVLEEVRGLSIAVAAFGTSHAQNHESMPNHQSQPDLGHSAVAKTVRFPVGTLVKLTSFGLGPVLATEGSGLQEVAVVQFRVGQRRLLVRYAPLVVASPGDSGTSE